MPDGRSVSALGSAGVGAALRRLTRLRATSALHLNLALLNRVARNILCFKIEQKCRRAVSHKVHKG